MNNNNNKYILALSSSRVGNSGYLETALPLIKQMLGETALNIAFIPFASVVNDYETYTNMVRDGLRSFPHTINTVTPAGAKDILETADVIMVGGGNTFKLLHDLYALDLIDMVRNKIISGTPYIGWSAGANILSPTIGTTNDMPVIEPKSFNALGLLPFQLNPHYNNALPPGHRGETRDQRLQEFVKMNPELKVIALPEGAAVQLMDGELRLAGVAGVMLFSAADNKVIKAELQQDQSLNNLLFTPA